MRDRVTATVDPAIKEEQVRATDRAEGRPDAGEAIDHVVGSLERPMTDADLEAKFMALVDGVLPAAQARALMDLCWKIETLTRASDLATAARTA